MSERIPATAKSKPKEAFSTTTASGKRKTTGLAPVSAPYLSAKHNKTVKSAKAAKATDASASGVSAPSQAETNAALSNLGVGSMDEQWGYGGSRPIVIGGRSYSAQDNVAQCMDVNTGRIIWRQTFNTDPSHVRTLTTISEAGNKLYIGSSRGSVICLAKSNGARLWSCALNGPVTAQPVIDHGRVYVTTETGYLYCIDTHDPSATGWPMWGGSPAHNGGRG